MTKLIDGRYFMTMEDARQFDLVPGKKYTIKYDEGGKVVSGKNVLYPKLTFLYATNHILFFRNTNGILTTFLRNNIVTKVVGGN
mgnify:FL=1